MPMCVAGMVACNLIAGSPTVRAQLFPDGVIRVFGTPDYQLSQVAPVQGIKRGRDHVDADDQVLLV